MRVVGVLALVVGGVVSLAAALMLVPPAGINSPRTQDVLALAQPPVVQMALLVAGLALTIAGLAIYRRSG